MTTIPTPNPLLPLGNWYPTGSECPSRSGHYFNSHHTITPSLYLNPKYLIPQYFHTSLGLSDLTFFHADLPERVLPQKEHDALFPEAPQGLTPCLMLVRVTPGVWSWVLKVRAIIEDRCRSGAGSGLRQHGLYPFQLEMLSWFLRWYTHKVYSAEEIREAEENADRHLRQGGSLSDLLPQPDEIEYDLVRFGWSEKWLGWDSFADRVRERRKQAAGDVSTDTDDNRSARSAQGPGKVSKAKSRPIGAASPNLFA